MASLALDPAYRRVEVDEFLLMDFGGARAELEDGIIFMMAGGTVAHARLAARIIRHLGNALDGSGCEPFGSDFAVRTAERTIRYPDVSIFCGAPVDEDGQLAGDPRVVVEVLSPSTASHDQKVKLVEYQALAGIREILFVHPDEKWVRIVRRDGETSWSDRRLAADNILVLPSVGASLPLSLVFGGD